MKKFHKKFGEIEILNSDEVITLVRTASGEEKKLMTKYMGLSDTPFPVGEPKPILPVKAKKLNPANFMRKEEFAKSKYSTMDKNDFEEERQRVMWGSKSM